MSTTKRARQRQPEQPITSSAMPPAKRAKLAKDNQSGLAFLTDERQRAGKVISAKPTNGTNPSRSTRADESSAAISGQDAANDIPDDDASVISSSSDEPSSSSEDADDVIDVSMTNGDAEHTSTALTKPKTNGVTEAEEQDENAAPSFGELLQTAHPEIIDVNATLDGPDALVKANASESRALQAPSATSLATVLSQALRTNDRELLESCLQTKDTTTIRSTIQRLQSPLVADLMQKLAERLHKRPGRAGPLMVWVQWSLVAHGGYLAGQPQVVKKLKTLRQVVKERAGSLPSLITLKGKLDLLGAQVELRRNIRSHNEDVDESDESDDDVVYVEGDDVESSSDEEDEGDLKLIQQTPRANGTAKSKKARQQDSDEEMDGDIPLINGIDEDAEMESLAGDEDDEELANGGFIDDEAEESEGDESIDSEEEDSASASELDEDDNDDSSSEDEVAVVPQKSARPVRRAALLKKRS